MLKFNNAEQAFEYLYFYIISKGVIKKDTIFVSNVGFEIRFPLNNHINTSFRKWSYSYAEREFKWYLSRNRSVENLIKYAPIWDKMHSGNYIVNSNYGWQWNRQDQLNKVINLLKEDKDTRRAVISLYDGKEIDSYYYDTPCTLSITFSILYEKLNMCVVMRSNDLWYGFCNDQYCFSELQKIVAENLNISVGVYYHFVQDLHLYKNTI